MNGEASKSAFKCTFKDGRLKVWGSDSFFRKWRHSRIKSCQLLQVWRRKPQRGCGLGPVWLWCMMLNWCRAHHPADHSVGRASLSSAWCRPTLHLTNLPGVGLCLVHQYLLQTSQLAEEISREKPVWEGRHLWANLLLLGVQLHYKRTTCEHKHWLLCWSCLPAKF